MNYKYLSWGMNDVLRVYHQHEGERLTRRQKIDAQAARNMVYAESVRLSSPKIYMKNAKAYCKSAARYLIYSNILAKAGEKEFVSMHRPKWKPMGRLFAGLACIPALALAPAIRKRRCSF